MYDCNIDIINLVIKTISEIEIHISNNLINLILFYLETLFNLQFNKHLFSI